MGNLIFELLPYHPEIPNKSIALITQQEFVLHVYFSRWMFVTRFEKGALQKLWLHLGSLQYNEAVSGEQLVAVMSNQWICLKQKDQVQL